MAPEPSHLVVIPKSCPRCGSQDVKYCYDNNKKPTQPRYKCNGPGCGGRFFTLGGKCRGVDVQAHRNPIGVAGDRRARTAKRATVSLPSRGRPGSRTIPKSEPVGNISERGERLVTGFELAENPTAGSGGRPAGSPAGDVEDAAIGATRAPRNPESGPIDKNPVGAVDVVVQLAAGVAMPQGGGANSEVDWVKAVLGIPPYDLVREPKRLKQMKFTFGGKELVRMFFDDSRGTGSHEE